MPIKEQKELKHFNRDPQRGMDRGRGWYYKRYYKGGLWWSKYTDTTDAVLKHKREKYKKYGKDIKEAEEKSPHMADFKTKGDRKTHRVGGRGPKGYF